MKALLRSFHKARIGHSVLDLLREVSKDLEVPEQLWGMARILDQYYIPPRYPNAFSEGAPSNYYTWRQAEEAIRYSEVVISFVEEHVKKVLDKTLEKIVSKFKVDLVLLHGSYAKGTYIEEYSDVDIIVVSDDFEGVPIGERLAILAELLAGMEKTVEAIAYTRKEFIKHARF